jgi:hypothetical protein
MGITNILVNETKKEYICPSSLGLFGKPMELAWNDTGSVVSMSKAWQFLTNAYIEAPLPYKDKYKLVRKDAKIWDVVNRFGSWAGDVIKWDYEDRYHTKYDIETIDGKKYLTSSAIALEEIMLDDNYPQLIEPIYKNIGTEVRAMFEYWHDTHSIREYKIGKPFAKNVEDEEYYTLKFYADNFNKTYRERLKEAKSRGDKAPILFIDYTHVLKYTDGRVAFLDSVIDTSDEEAVKDINKNLQLKYNCV